MANASSVGSAEKHKRPPRTGSNHCGSATQAFCGGRANARFTGCRNAAWLDHALEYGADMADCGHSRRGGIGRGNRGCRGASPSPPLNQRASHEARRPGDLQQNTPTRSLSLALPRAQPTWPSATRRKRQAAAASSRTRPASATDRTAPAPCARPASNSSGTRRYPSHRHASAATARAMA